MSEHDMNEHDMNDDDIIHRLRSALDEVSEASADDAAADTATPPVRDGFGTGRWIAVAAAVALIGAATVVLVQHRGSDDATTGATASTSSPSPSTTNSVTSTSDAPRSTVPAGDVAWYTFDLPWLTPGAPEFETCCKPWPAPGPDLAMAWGDVRGIDHGLLLLRVKRSATGAPPELTFEPSRLTTERTDALTNEVTEGSGLPYVLNDPSMELLGNGLLGDGNLVTQRWSDAGTHVSLSVGDYRGQLRDLTRAPGWTMTRVAGSVAYRVDDDMGSTFIWRTPVGTWATLHIDIELSKRIDEILASLHPAPLPTPAPQPGNTTTTIFASAATYTAKGVTIIDSGTGPMIAFSLADSLPPQGGDVPLANFDWSMVDGEQTVNGTTWGDNYDVTGTWDGHTFTLTGPPTPATHTGPPVEPTHNSLTTGCTLERMKPMLDALGTLDYKALGLIMTGSYNWDGHCGVQVRALFDTPEVRAAMAKVGDDVTVTFAFQPVTRG